MKNLVVLMISSVLLFGCGQKKAELLYQEGLKHFSAGNCNEAIDYFTRATKKNKYHARAFFSRGMVYFSLSEYDPAFMDFQQALAINPLLAEAHLEIGKVQLKRMMPNQRGALASFSKAIDVNQKYANAYFHRGLLRDEMMEPGKAIADLNKAIEFNPGYYEAFFYRARVFEKQYDYTNALKDVNTALFIKNDFADGYNLRGLIYLKMGNYKNACSDFEQAVKGIEKPGKEYFNLGFAKSKIRDYNGALIAFNQSLEFAPGIALTHFERGNIWEKLGNTNKACQDWKKAADLYNPNAINKFREKCQN